MKAKYIEWHNNYPFELGEIYDIIPHNDEWVRFEDDNQLYRKECFEFVGVLKALVSHVDDFGLLPRTINQIQRETIVKEYEELESKATKWDDPQTQAHLEFGKAVKLALENDLVIKKWMNEAWVISFDGEPATLLISWYNKQRSVTSDE